MLRLIYNKTGQVIYKDKHLNTSHVKVNLILAKVVQSIGIHLNTSHVKVNPTKGNDIEGYYWNLNTSHVKVNRS